MANQTTITANTEPVGEFTRGDLTEKQMTIPGPDHPITVAPTSDHVVVRVGDQVVARTDRALTLAEAGYADVQYVPLEDVDGKSLRRSDHQTYCPYKGDASYYTLVTREGELENVIWTYEEPFDAVREIAGHVAFYADRVDVIVG
jgi:uncharacterized protein (DUF427 family)